MSCCGVKVWFVKSAIERIECRRPIALVLICTLLLLTTFCRRLAVIRNNIGKSPLLR